MVDISKPHRLVLEEISLLGYMSIRLHKVCAYHYYTLTFLLSIEQPTVKETKSSALSTASGWVSKFVSALSGGPAVNTLKYFILSSFLYE